MHVVLIRIYSGQLVKSQNDKLTITNKKTKLMPQEEENTDKINETSTITKNKTRTSGVHIILPTTPRYSNQIKIYMCNFCKLNICFI